MKSYAIFDFDGTLADSMEIWMQVCSRLLASHGVTPPKDIDQRLLTKNASETCRYLIEHFLPNCTEQQLTEDTDCLVHDWYRSSVELRSGVLPFLQTLQQHNVRMGVLSSTKKTHLLAAMERLGMLNFFEFVVGGTDDPVGKSDPKAFAYAAKRFEADCTECVMFEDSLYAIESANAAGCKTVGIYDRFSKQNQQAIKAAANVYITDFDSADPAEIFEWK